MLGIVESCFLRAGIEAACVSMAHRFEYTDRLSQETEHCTAERERESEIELCYQYCLLKRVIMCSFMVLSVLNLLIESHTMRVIQNFPPDKGQSEPFHRTQ